MNVKVLPLESTMSPVPPSATSPKPGSGLQSADPNSLFAPKPSEPANPPRWLQIVNAVVASLFGPPHATPGG